MSSKQLAPNLANRAYLIELRGVSNTLQHYAQHARAVTMQQRLFSGVRNRIDQHFSHMSWQACLARKAINN